MFCTVTAVSPQWETLHNLCVILLLPTSDNQQIHTSTSQEVFLKLPCAPLSQSLSRTQICTFSLTKDLSKNILERPQDHLGF